MDVPLELSFVNLESSEAVEARVRERVAKLEKLFPRLVSCRVAIGRPHRQHQTGNTYRVRIDMSVPGHELVVSHEPHHAKDRYADPDVYTAIKDAFQAAERQLKDHKEQLQGEVKQTPMPMHGQVVSVTPDQDFGFLLDNQGSQLYFHRNSLMNEALEKLQPGDHVHYVGEIGETGPIATKVWRVESPHQRRGDFGTADEGPQLSE